MKNLKRCSILLFLLISSVAYTQQGWFLQNSGTNLNLTKAFMLDSLNYIVLTDSTFILRTSNGGTNWISQPSDHEWKTGYFVNSSTGFLLQSNLLTRTTNGGNTWTNINVPFYSYYAVQFMNSNTGYITGTDPSLSSSSPVVVVSKTTNGGANWVTHQGIDLGYGSFVKFYNNDSGQVMVVNRLNFTTNGGLNWTKYNTAPFSVHAMSFLNFNTVIANGMQGYISKTTNRGANWNNISINGNYWVRDIFFWNESHGYLVGDGGTIRLSINGGDAWGPQVSNTTADLKSIAFRHPLTGLAVGNNGTIVKTNTGGLVSVNTVSSEVPSSFSLHQNYPNPFNPETVIKFDLAKTSNVKITVYSSLGQEMQVLANENKPAGIYEIKFDGSSYSGGIYFYRITAGEFSETKKMLLVK